MSNTTISTTQTSTTSSLNLEIRHNRSTRTALLHALIKPLKPKLTEVSSGSDKEGSDTLKIPRSVRKKFEVKELYLYDSYSYLIKPKTSEKSHTNAKKDIYYFAGGSWMQGPTDNHWKFCCEVANKLPEYDFYVVSHPLAPKNPASKALPHLRTWFLQVLEKAVEKDRTVTLAGDSSGANLAMSLAFWTSDHLKAAGYTSTPLRQLMLVCPPVDLKKDNPDIEKMEKYDPVMTKKSTVDCARVWAGDGDLENPELSPMFASLDALKEYDVKIHGVIAGYDVLAPDAIKFREKLTEAGIKGDWLQWEKQMHCFPMAFSYHLPESVQGKDWIVSVLHAED